MGDMAQLSSPSGIAVGYDGVYVADTGNHRIRHIDWSGMIETVAGTGQAGDSGDNGPATAAKLSSPIGISYSYTRGPLFIADTGNHRVRRIDHEGVITTLAGTGVSGFSGDNGFGPTAKLASPIGYALGALTSCPANGTGYATVVLNLDVP